MKHPRKEKGFTIVELLIVIIVIGILASISAVSYIGSRDRARTAKAVTNAATVKKVAETYYAKNNAYPTTVSQFRSGLITVPSNVLLLSAANPTLNASTGESLVAYKYVLSGSPSSATGACIYYWDFTTKAISAVTFLGTATAANCSPSTGSTLSP